MVGDVIVASGIGERNRKFGDSAEKNEVYKDDLNAEKPSLSPRDYKKWTDLA